MRPGTLFLRAVMIASTLVADARPVASQEYLDAIRATPDPTRGEQYFTVCATCHGNKGGGSTDGKIPRIGGQHFRVIVRQLVAFRHGQRWDILMENFADRHRLADAQAIADVADYVSQLVDPTPPGLGNGELVAQGAEIYSEHCMVCHGSSGQGDPDKAIPKIADQHYEYLRRQIYDAVDGRRPGFPSSHVRLLARLDHDQIAAVADYLSRIPPYAQTPITAESIPPKSARPIQALIVRD